MNKNLLLGLLTAGFVGISSLGMAQNNNAAAGNGVVDIMTVSQIGNVEDNATVTLQGTLTQNLGNNTYVFTDSTGNINAIIESGDWNGNTFNPNAVVLVTGQVNKNGNVSEIDVTEIQNAQQ
ncbi:MAG: NirD/YgiW/YdeI family stress tolerance protein [Proteobacteria bacterium]|nr:NirD/YgiW/YdeI family stress tolerance protein [Pseudomonadota bacterium]